MSSLNKFLTYEGLIHYDEKLKEYVGIRPGTSPYSIQQLTQEGAENIAGCKGYYWQSVDATNKTITLSTTQSDTAPNSFEIPWVVGDVVSIVDDIKYDSYSTITAVNDNIITVDILPSGSWTRWSEENLHWSDYFVFVPEKPDQGEVDGGPYAIALGDSNKAVNWCAISLGRQNKSIGQYAYTEGRSNISQVYCHAEGRNNKSLGEYSHVENKGNTAKSLVSHIEGQNNIGESGEGLHIEGQNNTAIGLYNHTEGSSNKTLATNGHTQGGNNINGGNQTFVGGNGNVVNYNTTTNAIVVGGFNFVHGTSNTVFGEKQHVHGTSNNVTGLLNTVAGQGNTVSGQEHVVAGLNNTVTGARQDVGGQSNQITSGNQQFVRGASNKITSGWVNTVFGSNHTITGTYTFTAGESNTNSHEASSVFGIGNKSGRTAQTVIGSYNVVTNNAMFIVGNGDNDSSRSNAFEVLKDGGVAINGVILTSTQLQKILNFIDTIEEVTE